MNTPFNTGKVKIGSAYQAPIKNHQHPDQVWVQDIFRHQERPSPYLVSDMVIIGLAVAVIISLLAGVI